MESGELKGFGERSLELREDIDARRSTPWIASFESVGRSA